MDNSTPEARNIGANHRPEPFYLRMRLPLWPFTAVTVALMIGLLAYALLAHGRTEQIATDMLFERAGAVIAAIEANISSSRRSRMTQRTDFLLQELAMRSGARYIAITAPDGTIISHSDPIRQFDMLYFESLPITPEQMRKLAVQHTLQGRRMTLEGENSFVAYRLLRSRINFFEGIQLFVFIGMDPEPLAEARNTDLRNTLILGLGGLLCGAFFLISLYLTGRARTFRLGQINAETLTEKIFDSLADGLILLDKQGNIRRINHFALNWLNLEKALTGEDMEKVLPEPLCAIIRNIMSNSPQKTVGFEELEIPAKHGTLPLGVHGGEISGGDLGHLGYLILLRDLSERKNFEAELRRREKMSAIGNLAAGVAHELRNPLSSIKGYATYFGQCFAPDDPNNEAAKIMAGEVERLNRVITDLMNMALPAKPMPKPVDLAELARRAITLLKPEADARNVEALITVADDLPFAQADPDQLQQVILNICLNSLDAMPNGGALAIRVFHSEADRISMEIQDNGCGIEPDKLSTIFDHYYTTKGKGIGLGLPTVHKIIEAHGGDIQVRSQPGLGTAFTVRLPVYL
jgi:two-component system sensor histidine kinase HydH